MKENRRFDRNRIWVAGAVTYGDQRASLHCVVRDLSDGGARLLIDEPMRTPRQMDLTVGAQGDTCRVHVMWRGETEVGVAFLPNGSREVGGAVEASHPVDVDVPPPVETPRRVDVSHNVIALPLPARIPAIETDQDRLARRIARFVRAASARRRETDDV